MVEGVRTPSEADPLAGASGVLLTVDEVRRIIGAAVAEVHEIEGLVTSATLTLSVEDYGDSLRGASVRLAQVKRCLTELLDGFAKA